MGVKGFKMAKVGRPPKFETPEQMQVVIDKYFETDAFVTVGVDKTGEVVTAFRPTVAGLAIALGMTSHALRNYEVKEEFLTTVKGAKLRIEQALEAHLYGNSVAGVIFNLKANFGFKDQVSIDNTSSDGSMSPKSIELNIIDPQKSPDEA